MLPGQVPQQPGNATSLNEVHTAVRKARERYDNALDQYEMARIRVISARNELNKTQHAFDEAVVAVKKNAPCDSHWHVEASRPAAAGANNQIQRAP